MLPPPLLKEDKTNDTVKNLDKRDLRCFWFCLELGKLGCNPFVSILELDYLFIHSLMQESTCLKLSRYQEFKSDRTQAQTKYSSGLYMKDVAIKQGCGFTQTDVKDVYDFWLNIKSKQWSTRCGAVVNKSDQEP